MLFFPPIPLPSGLALPDRVLEKTCNCHRADSSRYRGYESGKPANLVKVHVASQLSPDSGQPHIRHSGPRLDMLGRDLKLFPSNSTDQNIRCPRSLSEVGGLRMANRHGRISV